MFRSPRHAHTTAAAALVAVAVLILTACGGDSTSSSSAPDTASGDRTISVSDVGGVGDVLVDSDGSALYAADQEASGDVLCVASCTSIWLPLTLPAGTERPTAGPELVGDLGLVSRPDGGRQVTFEGRPLYRFVEDGGPGVVTGDGFADDFDGQPFEWHVAGPDGFSDASSDQGPLGY